MNLDTEERARRPAPGYPEPPRRRRGLGWSVLRLGRFWRWVIYPVLAGLALLAVFYGAREAGERVGVAIAPDDEIAPGTPVVVDVPVGAGASQIATLLDDAGVVGGSDFERIVRLRNVGNQLKAGVYQLEAGMEAEDAVQALLEGPGERAVYTVRVREGATITAIIDGLAAETPWSAEELAAPLLDGSVTSTLLPAPATELTDWEGLLFPATYELFGDDPPVAILTRMVREMENRVAAVEWSGIESRGLSIYDGLKVASLIETEAKLDLDRPLIASVIYNRLSREQLLQIDATVQYALPVRKPALSLADLEVDSPYNTYQNPGLPPTPIAVPSAASLQAAAAPAETDFIYYVLANEEGGHAFTASAEEFEQLKQQAREAGLLPP